ncbi:MAG: methyltransferase domain-containing protein, partial [Gammaproteobacteria bacterium]|nr:methyltransferase domain-containing protein [Gammaproteobacteria bacterium]
GTGSGYLTALLASQARHVITVDIHEEFQHKARETLEAHNITNVTYEVGDAHLGWDEHKPYDVIVVTGSLPLLPESFQRNLAVGGRLIAFAGDDPAMEMILITRVSENEWSHRVLLETSVPALINAVEPERFAL